jgi:hypothetical protein
MPKTVLAISSPTNSECGACAVEGEERCSLPPEMWRRVVQSSGKTFCLRKVPPPK